MGMVDARIVDKISCGKHTTGSSGSTNTTIQTTQQLPDIQSTFDLTMISRRELVRTYDDTRMYIRERCTSRAEYTKLCKYDQTLPRDPQKVFGTQFTNWVEYLGIIRNKYTLVEYMEIARHAKVNGVSVEVYALTNSRIPAEDIRLAYYQQDGIRNWSQLKP